MKVDVYPGEHGMWFMRFANGSYIRGCRLEPGLYETRAFHKDGTLGPTFQSDDPRRAEKLARLYLKTER